MLDTAGWACGNVSKNENNPPIDPDNDWLYEDINGYGRKDFDDVVKLL